MVCRSESVAGEAGRAPSDHDSPIPGILLERIWDAYDSTLDLLFVRSTTSSAQTVGQYATWCDPKLHPCPKATAEGRPGKPGPTSVDIRHDDRQ